MGPDLDLKGRRALVCGASMGIGRAAAVALAGCGASVIGLARSRDRLESLLLELRAAGGTDHGCCVADLDDRGALSDVIGELLADRGAIHVLVNNTGGPPPGRLLDASADDLLGAFSRHVLASHLLVQALLPGMVAADYGRIINVVSTSVRCPIPMLGVSNTTRGAMASWAKTLAGELPPGVTINNVLPGFTDTERLTQLLHSEAARQDMEPEALRAAWIAGIPEGRLAQPSETAATIAFLASPAAAYLRGVSLPVDGGRTPAI